MGGFALLDRGRYENIALYTPTSTRGGQKERRMGGPRGPRDYEAEALATDSA